MRFDPSLTATVDLAQGQGLVTVGGTGGVHLTARGLSFALELNDLDDVLQVEKLFLHTLPSRITRKQIQQLLEWT